MAARWELPDSQRSGVCAGGVKKSLKRLGLYRIDVYHCEGGKFDGEDDQGYDRVEELKPGWLSFLSQVVAFLFYEEN